jgi:hypothetical protein
VSSTDAESHLSATSAPPAFDLDSKVVYLPIRHHSPACAWHVQRVIETIRPAAVLIEGPRDATSLIDHLVDARTKAPIAIYTAYVDRTGEGLPRRQGAYYPLCDYSPELVALRAARAFQAETHFIDLTYPEMVVAENSASPAETPASDRVRSLQDESYLFRSKLMQAACRRSGARDPDDLWDTLFEHDFRDKPSEAFFREVLFWCALSRHDHTPERLHAEVHDVREQAMRAYVDDIAARLPGQRIVVVTGGFHTVALPSTTGVRPAPVHLHRPEDASVTLMRYGFIQLDRLNGYASGMPSPAFYQHIWEDRDTAALVVSLARELRTQLGVPSAAESAAALHHVRGLSMLRGHLSPTREDLLDGVRSLFVKGSIDVEGVAVLATARKLLAGDRIGSVPPEAGRPPLVQDFERTSGVLRVALDASQEQQTTLDLYRSAPHRAKSRFFYRLKLLDIPFAKCVRGPDYVAGAGLERIQEVWRFHWQPATEARLIEQSRYGATLEEAAHSLLLEKFAEADRAGHRSDLAARLVLEGCRCGLQRQAAALLERTRVLVANDPSFVSVVGAASDLDLLRLSREPLEAHDLTGVPEVVAAAWTRAATLVPTLASTGEQDESAVLDQLCAWAVLTDTVAGVTGATALRDAQLRELSLMEGANPVVLGAACGLLHAGGTMPGDALGSRLSGLLAGGRTDPSLGARFLRGALRTSRSACWQEPSVVSAVHETLGTLPEDTFITTLPHLRLAFSDLTPREADAVAHAAAELAGAPAFATGAIPNATESDLLLGLRTNELVGQLIARDGWRPGGGTNG